MTTSPLERPELVRLDERRRHFEQSLSKARGAFDRELGALAPRRRIWAIPIVGIACGLALALAIVSRKKRRRSESAVEA